MPPNYSLKRTAARSARCKIATHGGSARLAQALGRLETDVAESDDSIRSPAGVVCCLRDLPNGQVRLVLDDVANESSSTLDPWTHRVLFTWKDFGSKEIDDLALSERELAGFGHSVLARLVAYRKHPASK
jgi:hypothetical protein